MSSKRNKEGYLLSDNRAGPGFNDEMARLAGLPNGAGRGLFEAPSYTSRHCQSVVIMNPARTRERAYCRGCDSYLCDGCGAIRGQTYTCKTFEQVIDEVLTAAEKQTGEPASKILLLP